MITNDRRTHHASGQVRPPRRARRALAGLAATGVGVLAACNGSCGGPTAGTLARGRPSPEAGDAGSDRDAPSTPAATRSPDVETGPATALGVGGATLNGRAHPHGRPARAWFEIGETTAYGRTTAARPLPPPLEAHYHESWDTGLGGWAGGMSMKDLVHRAAGGARGGYVAYTDTQGAGDDVNHVDGIGIVHLPQYGAPGSSKGAPSFQLAAGSPDFRDARISVHLRGRRFVPNGTELAFWMQCDSDVAAQDTDDWRRANWAFTGRPLTDALASGAWEHVTYRLPSDSTQWSYAGRYVAQNRPNYAYWPLEESLSHVNNNFFHILLFVALHAEPRGGIDFDELDITYRNHSLVRAAAGARLVRVTPESAEPADRLVDGYRHGEGRTWKSAPSPTNPVEIVYELAPDVTVERVQIHQHEVWPSDEVDVSLSNDGRSWAPLAQGRLPRSSPGGPNFTHWAATGLGGRGRYLRVAIRSGFRKEHWGLGEIEVFGSGATFVTEDDWATISRDALELAPGRPLHYRLVVETDAGRLVGEDRTFTPADGTRPLVETGAAFRLGRSSATVEGRVNALGSETTVRVEYGASASYGSATGEVGVGLEETPRTVRIALTDLAPGTTWHYRIVATGPGGVAAGADATFTTSP